MSDHPIQPITDPDNVPVRVVNGMAQIGIIGGLVAITLTTARVGIGTDGKPNPDVIIAARLRFDLEMARIIRDKLSEHIALLKPPETKAN